LLNPGVRDASAIGSTKRYAQFEMAITHGRP
jgi:hypothetical protein